MAKCCPSESRSAGDNPQEWFGNMIGNCLDYATKAKENGRGIVGIMCEFTPRELILAADALPVCLCGGSAETIGPAEQHLPANLCPLIKSTYGYHVQKTNPFLEMADMLVAETTCDGKKKMYELLARSRDMYVLELTQKPDDTDARKHWIAELKKLKAALEEKFGTAITDDKIRRAISVMNRERSLRRHIAELMKADTPPLTGRELLDFKSNISGVEADFIQYQKAIELFRSKQRTCGRSRAVRVMLTGVPVVHGAENIIDIIESTGGLVVCMENCTGLKPIIEDVEEHADDPIEALAEKYFHLPCSVMTRNDRRLELLETLAKDYNVDCVVDLVWQACLTYDVESYFVKHLVEDKLALPYLKVETDYSPSDSARIAVRLEALFEMVREKATEN